MAVNRLGRALTIPFITAVTIMQTAEGPVVKITYLRLPPLNDAVDEPAYSDAWYRKVADVLRRSLRPAETTETLIGRIKTQMNDKTGVGRMLIFKPQGVTVFE